MRVEGDVLRCMANHGPSRQWPVGTTRPLSRDWVTGRAVIDRTTVQVGVEEVRPEPALYPKAIEDECLQIRVLFDLGDEVERRLLPPVQLTSCEAFCRVP